jgi:murein L,D-transpeptidase YcbB/YkuD
LREPIQVILFYITAVVMPEDGTVGFAEDIYGHDVKLEKALADAVPRSDPPHANDANLHRR